MLVAREKRRSVAAENENNQRVSSRLGKLWRSLSVADKEPRQRKAAAAAAVHRRKHPGYVYNPREAQRCKRQARRTEAVASKLKNGTSRDEQQQPSISTAVAQGRCTPEYQQQQHPPPPLQSNEQCATSAARGNATGAGQGMPLGRKPLSRRRLARLARLRGPTTCSGSQFPCHHQSVRRTENTPCPTLTQRQLAHSKQPETPNVLTVLDNQLYPTVLDDDDDSFDQGGIRETQGFADGTPGQEEEAEEEEARRSTRTDPRTATTLDTLGSANDDPGKSRTSPSASLRQTTNRARLRSIARLLSRPAAEAATAVPDVASDPGVGVASSSCEVQHSYQLRSRIPRPPNASMLVAHGKRRSVAAENPNENNQRVSSRSGKLWRSLSVADKEPRQRKAVNKKKYPGYVYSPRETHQCKRQARRTKEIAKKLVNGTSGDEQQHPSISVAVAQGRGTPQFQHQYQPPPLPPQRKEQRATSAALGNDSVAAQGMLLPRPSATVPATASARSAARPYNVHRFPGPLPPSVRETNRENAVSTALLTASRAFKEPETPNALTMLDNKLYPTVLDDEDDSSAGTSPFDQGGIRETQGSADGAPGKGQPSSSAAGCTAV
nr:uncharacterized protein LOC126543267 [Dermacentor andersoni]